MTISNAWYFVEDGKQVGPFTEEEVKGFVRQGRVRSETLVWHDGMTDWMPLYLSKGSALLLASETAIRSSAPPLPGGGPYGDRSQGPGAPMGFFEAIASCFGKYATFSGRASRSEFWYFSLFFLLVALLISFPIGFTASGFAIGPGRSGLIFTLILLAFMLPNLAVAVRRLHDIDFSGWWLLIGLVPAGSIVLLVFYCLRPTPGRNRFG